MHLEGWPRATEIGCCRFRRSSCRSRAGPTSEPCIHPSRRPRSLSSGRPKAGPGGGLLIRNLGLGGGARTLGRASLPLGSGGEWLDFDGIAHVLEAHDQALGLCGLGTAVEMVCTEILIDGSIFEHVKDGGEDGGGDVADGFFRPAAAAKAQVLSLVVASLFVFGRLGTLNHGRLEPRRAFAKPVRASSPGALVVAWTQASPGQQMSRGGEAAHVGASLGDDGVGAKLADAG